jgi:uncharacterized protein
MADGRTIRVQGHGEVRVAPDRARLMLGVQRTDANAQAAVESNSETVRSVVDALKSAGVPEDAVQTSNFSIYYDAQNQVYTVNNQVAVRVAEVGTVGRLLGLAIRAGANMSGGISFEVEDSSEAEVEALRRAVDDARTRAETLAASLGVALGDVVSVDAPPPNPNIHAPVFARRALASPAFADVPVASGEITIPADIEVVYRIRVNET